MSFLFFPLSGMKSNPGKSYVPRTVLIGGKVCSSYLFVLLCIYNMSVSNYNMCLFLIGCSWISCCQIDNSINKLCGKR